MILIGFLLAAAQAAEAPPLPSWALSSPAAWIELQCADEDETTPPGPCRRAARNRLAMARAESLAAEPARLSPAERVAAGEPLASVTGQRCRWIRGGHDDGEGGGAATITRICSDDPNNTGESTRAVLERLFDEP